MKIGLLSPYFSHNYGTVLQAFALENYLKSKGHKCEYIQYCLFKNFFEKLFFIVLHPLYLFKYYKNKKQNSKALKYAYLSTEDYSQILVKNKRFCEQFITISPRRSSYFNAKGLNSDYELFIVGSDQTWSPEIIYNYSVFFLPFVESSAKKASYACSFGTSNIDFQYKKFLRKSLSSFKYVSCRDKKNADMLTSLLQKTVTNVIDPTLLLNKEDWSKFMKTVDMPPKYILCYILGEKQCITEYANKIAKEKGLPVYHILTRPCHENNPNVLKGIGCQEFLYLIANCELLVTDSFHGTIFSINFQKNFVSFDKYVGASYDNGRLADVLKEFNLLDHYHIDTDFSYPSEIDYNKINSILETKRKDSIQYLQKVLL